MNRIAGLETEYGCLLSLEDGSTRVEAWVAKIRKFIFESLRVGVIDTHFRDYEEPPGNGGFLLNGGRVYVDMGHLEYASPECRTVRDAVVFDRAGESLLQRALTEMGIEDQVAFIKNNVDHRSGATFGCHENYSIPRETPFSRRSVEALLCFLVTRQIFTGSGRVGSSMSSGSSGAVSGPHFQLSQRADYIVNDIYQWVQFNRSIINVRDEPLADSRRFRRLHLLLGDSNMSPFANALKVGTTSLILDLIELGVSAEKVSLEDAVAAMRTLSHSGDPDCPLLLASGGNRTALSLQYAFLEVCKAQFAGRDLETDWILESWAFVLEGLAALPGAGLEPLIGAVDWVGKRYLLTLFQEEEGLAPDDPWLESIDLQYHNIHPENGLFQALPVPAHVAEWNSQCQVASAETTPPSDTRARGRGEAVAILLQSPRSYVIDWDHLCCEGGIDVPMPDPFLTYSSAVVERLARLEGLGNQTEPPPAI